MRPIHDQGKRRRMARRDWATLFFVLTAGLLLVAYLGWHAADQDVRFSGAPADHTPQVIELIASAVLFLSGVLLVSFRD